MLPSPDDSQARTRIGRYLIRGRIGRGGMGMVYRAVDEALEREVALKTLIAEGSSDSEGRQRFAVEAKAAARLQHPNIVIVYELGEDRGVPFIAMELLSGGDLEAVMRGGEPLCLLEKLDVAAQVCRGLAYAHEHGIVHRDMKPSNIRLLDDGTAKIMDFGIAKLGATHLTKAGMMVGTVHYMSPEQVRGKPLDGRSDVFSMGVILYELLAGQRPFRGDVTTQILFRIVNEEPPALDLKPLGSVGSRLGDVLARALAKDPAARYQTATEMADALSAVVVALERFSAPPPAAVEALAAARQTLRQGSLDAGLAALRALVAEHSEFVEAQRALRSAVREQKRRGDARVGRLESYPELEATFQPTQTRSEPETVLLAATVAADAPAAPAAAAPQSSRRLWFFGALAALGVLATLLAAGAALLSLRGRPVSRQRLAVRSQPPGAAVILNGRPSGVVTDGEVEIPDAGHGPVEITFRKPGHRDATRSLRLPLRPGDAVEMTLEALTPTLVVRTQPAGAAVALDGAVVGQSPVDVPLDTAREHRVSLTLDGYRTHETRLAAGQKPPVLDVTLERLAPPGIVVVQASYLIDVLWGGRPLARNAQAPRVSVPGGRQVLTLVAPAVFLRSDVSVNVAPGAETAISAPALGKLNIRATPDNCEVFVDGTFVDYPPILDRSASAGRHTVSFRWPDGKRAEYVVEVQGGTPAFVVGRRTEG